MRCKLQVFGDGAAVPLPFRRYRILEGTCENDRIARAWRY
jgi:hypothetical protein